MWRKGILMHHTAGYVKCCRCCEQRFGSSLRRKTELPYENSSTLGMYPPKLKMCSNINLYTNVHSSTIHNGLSGNNPNVHQLMSE